LLEGKTVNLRIDDKEEDAVFETECSNNVDFWGEYSSYGQISLSEMRRLFDNPPNLDVLVEFKRFIVQKKDGTKIGFIQHCLNQPSRMMEIGCWLVPSERGKGYGTEATQLMVDYLFLSKDIVRIQTDTNVGNKAAQKALEKAGFKKEGAMRKYRFVRGVWTDYCLYSILREEWKEPKILTRTA
jgi:RimJ/RimL family protein N-acetyltransferase